jgi:eukaryotic-like serine/threonine-protein kinase
MATSQEKWEAVKALFESALEQDRSERASFLEERCSDASIRAEVERLLAEHDQAGSFLSTPVLANVSPNFETPAQLLTTGELLAGRFRIIRFIAAGGMGQVYEAEDQELHERVAVKTIRPDILAQPTAVARFKREVHLARQVTHPNVCRIFDLFRHADESATTRGEIVFVSMELLKGQTLSSRLKDAGAMSELEALPLIRQMASALSAAHAAGIVHRDFKPGNVVLVKTSGQQTPRAVVTDFGLAAQSVLPDETVSVSTGQHLVGTPAYMSPEQLEGRPATAASDIYALGLVIYEMVTSAQAFQGDTPISAALKRLSEGPIPPRNFRPELGPVWEAAILRCLERDPALRPSNPERIVEALSSEDSTVITEAAPRKKVARLLAPALTLLLIAAIGAGYIARRGKGKALPTSPTVASVHPRRSVAVLGFKNLSQKPNDAWLSTALSEELTTELAAGEQLRTVTGEDVAKMKVALSLPDTDGLSRATLSKIHQISGSDFVILGSYLEVGDQLRVDLSIQDTAGGETIAKVSDTGTGTQLFDLISRTGTDLRRRLGVAELTPADANALQASQSTNPEATRLYAEYLQHTREYENVAARDLLQKAIAADPNFALAHAALAGTLMNLGYNDQARTEAQKAFDLSSNLSRENRLQIEALLRESTHEWNKAIDLWGALFKFFPDNLKYGLKLAYAQRMAGKGKDAQATIETLRKLPPPASTNPNLDLDEARLAFTLGDFKRDLAAATQAEQRAIAIGEPFIAASAQLEKCSALRYLEQFAEAAIACQNAKETYSRVGDPVGMDLALLRSALIAESQGDLDGAQRLFDQSLAIAQKVGDNLNIAANLNDLGILHVLRGEHHLALQSYQQALAVNRQINRKYGINIAMSSIAHELADSGDLTQAIPKYREVLLQLHEAGQQSGQAEVLSNLAIALHQKGELAESEKTLNQALEMCHRVGTKSTCAVALSELASVQESRGNLDQAKSFLQQALAISSEIADDLSIAANKTAAAQLSIDEGHPEQGEPLARDARESLKRHGYAEVAIFANLCLAQTLLAQAKASDAAKELDSLPAEKADNEAVRLTLGLVKAGILSASHQPQDQTAALQLLKSTQREAAQHGYKEFQLQARLSIAELEIQSGKAVTGRAHLAALEKDATSQGFLLVAHKAAAARTKLS